MTPAFLAPRPKLPWPASDAAPHVAKCNKWVAAIVLCLLLGSLPTPGHAQSVRALVLVQGRDSVPLVVTPASGTRPSVETPAFLVLSEADGSEVARIPIDTSGFNAIMAPRPGRYHLAAERIGYRSPRSPSFDLDVDQILDVAIDFPTDRVELPDAQLEGLACVAPGNVPVVDALWTEALKALAAAAWSDGGRTFRYVATEYDRSVDIDGRVVAERTRTTAGKPRFPAGGPRTGFVVQSAGGSTAYYAPTPGVLFDRSFTRSHCFSIVRDDANQGRIGLAFRPTQGTSASEVSGTFWLDDQTLELRVFDYSFTALEQSDAGGRIELARVSPARWTVQRWSIRVPRQQLRGGGAVLAGYREVGGEITEISPSTDVLAAGPLDGERPVVWPMVTDESSMVRLAHRMSFGLKGGIGRASISGSGVDTEQRNTLHASAFIAWAPASAFALQLEGTYARRGAQDGSGRLEIDYVDVPVLFVLRPVGQGSLNATPQLSVGPTLSYRLRCRVSDVLANTNTDCHDDTATLSLGMTVGAGVHFRVGSRTILLEAAYLGGLSKANRGADNIFDFKNRALSFSFGLSFPFASGL